MPIPLLSQIVSDGVQSIPYASPAIKCLPWLLVVYILRLYFRGRQNGNERVMHGRVAIVTGGTSGIGAAVVRDLAARGTQLILLVSNPSDVFTIDYIEDLRERYGNEFIYAEKCDLADLHSIRQFATKFIDNSPPRRLDVVVCCAGLMSPPYTKRVTTKDGAEAHFGVNYLAHFHLLNLLSPLIRIQPPDRDVRILLATCPSYALGELSLNDLQFLQRGYPYKAPWKCYGAAKLALMTFGVEFQRRLSAYKRPDGEPPSARVFSIDPGLARTPGMRRWLSLGTLWGLALYVVTWPVWWLVLKSSGDAAQTFLTAAMSPECGSGEGGKFLKECKNQPYRKDAISNPELAKNLWDISVKLIEDLEKESARRRAEEKNKAGVSEGEVKEEEEQDKERSEKLRKKAMGQAAKRRELERLIKEEEKKSGSMDLPRVAAPPMVEPDTPARNTRSKTASRAVTPDVHDIPERPDTPSKNTRRRTKKA